jgi:hypothetical protein
VSSISASLSQALRTEFPEPHCAYCHSPERLLGIPLEADHIVPEAAGGQTEFGNLCLCCRSCNGYKGKRIHAQDPQTRRKVCLFHPRRQRWSAHFAWSDDGTRIIGLTATGRATIEALRMNNDLITNLRQLWVMLRLHPTASE